MGRRSRARNPNPVDGPLTADPDGLAEPSSTPRPARSQPRRREGRPTIDERPRAPWDPFPLAELLVLGGIVLSVVGLIGGSDRRSVTILLVGLLVASLGGLDTALREHLAGYRSHTLVLAGMPALLAAIALAAVAQPPVYVGIALALVVFGLGGYGLRELFQKRSGGRSWR